jgi:hypothetical protein
MGSIENIIREGVRQWPKVGNGHVALPPCGVYRVAVPRLVSPVFDDKPAELHLDYIEYRRREGGTIVGTYRGVTCQV